MFADNTDLISKIIDQVCVDYGVTPSKVQKWVQEVRTSGGAQPSPAMNSWLDSLIGDVPPSYSEGELEGRRVHVQ